jgi:hypothetical protein
MHKRQRTLDTQSGAPGQDETTVNQVIDEDGFMADRDDDGNGHDDDGQPKKRWGRRKLMMEFIQDKSRRGKTFSRMKGSEWCSSCPTQLL